MRNRWLVGGLVLSLVVNLLLVGFVAGRMTPGMGFMHMRPDPTMGLYRLIGFLPEARRDELKAAIGNDVRSIYPELRQVRALHRRIRDAVTADPFVRDDLVKALAELRQQLGSTQVAAHESFVEVVGKLTPEERKQLAETMKRPPRFGHERGPYRPREEERGPPEPP
jgi:uncharacterized membrane protein